MPRFDWFSWLALDSTATYLTFGAGVLVTVIGFFIGNFVNRKQPRTIRLTRVSVSSLFSVESHFKDKLQILYKGQSINSLYLEKFILRNVTSEIIESINISIKFESEIIDFDYKVENSQPDITVAWDQEKKVISLELPYFNPQKLYPDSVIDLSVYSLQPDLQISIQGTGRNWKAEYFDRVTYYESLYSGTEEAWGPIIPVLKQRIPFLGIYFSALKLLLIK
jgi:hypothetical protein